jgi:hypothetical protein
MFVMLIVKGKAIKQVFFSVYIDPAVIVLLFSVSSLMKEQKIENSFTFKRT